MGCERDNMYFYLSKTNKHTPLEEGMQKKVSKMFSIVSARKYARHIINTNFDISGLWVEMATEEGTFTKGYVFFDKSAPMYRGLGWVYVPLDRDRAVKLDEDGKIRLFSKRNDIHYAKKIREKFSW